MYEHLDYIAPYPALEWSNDNVAFPPIRAWRSLLRKYIKSDSSIGDEPVEDGAHEERVEAKEDECKPKEEEAKPKQPADNVKT